MLQLVKPARDTHQIMANDSLKILVSLQPYLLKKCVSVFLFEFKLQNADWFFLTLLQNGIIGNLIISRHKILNRLTRQISYLDWLAENQVFEHTRLISLKLPNSGMWEFWLVGKMRWSCCEIVVRATDSRRRCWVLDSIGFDGEKQNGTELDW